MIQLTKLLPFISSIKHFETLMVVLLDGGGPAGPLMLVEFHCDKWRSKEEEEEEGFHVPIRIHQLYPLFTLGTGCYRDPNLLYTL